MGRLKGQLILCSSLLLILFLIIGCGTNESIPDEGSVNLNSTKKQSTDDIEAAPADVKSSKEEEYDSPLEPEKIITTIDIHFETIQFDKTNKDLNGLIEKHDAYIENSSISYNPHHGNKSYRNAHYTIRVPKDGINSFKSDLNEIGNMISENTSKEDITKRYKDIESRLKVVEVKEERILTLLAKAEKIEDIIKLEEQLANIIYEKEELKISLMDMDDKVDYGTIYIYIQEVEKLTNQEAINTSFKTRFINAISDSVFFFKKALENLILLLVYVFPFVLIIGLIAFLGIKVFKRIRSSKD
ncbi:MAG TPA: DUF4349 domain-containing protein [Tepidimicrobium sp.]|nr:DUF4349 domain-containing protein [Tepidimicrobium sp.]